MTIIRVLLERVTEYMHCTLLQLNKQYKEDFVKTKREMRSLKKVHRRALKKMAEKEESYLDVCKERDELQLKVRHLINILFSCINCQNVEFH